MEQYAEVGFRKRKKRRILVIKKKLQLHFGIVVFISVFLATAIVGWDIYYTVHYKLLKFFAIDPDLALNLKLTNALLLAKLIIYGMIVFLISLFISNKVAGPIFRFEQSCEEIGEGDLTYRVRLR